MTFEAPPSASSLDVRSPASIPPLRPSLPLALRRRYGTLSPVTPPDLTGIRVGFAGVDTSHPAAYAKLLRQWGCDLIAVYDPGLIHGPDAGARFAAEHGIPHVASSLAQLTLSCDVVFVNSADWTWKAPAARTIAASGVAVFVDKPLGGGHDDWQTYDELFAAGARITGGSALQWIPQPVTEATGGQFTVQGDVVDYGVHAAALALACLGTNIERVSADQGRSEGLFFDAFWSDARLARIEIRPGSPGGYSAQLKMPASPTELIPLEIDLAMLTQRHLEQTLPHLLAGSAPRWTIQDLVLPERMIAAAKLSAQTGHSVNLSDSIPIQFDTASFIHRYRNAVRQG
jgi:hypothetical protein